MTSALDNKKISNTSEYRLEIFFDEYTGNFERELAAHLFHIFEESSLDAVEIFETMPEDEVKSLEWVDPEFNYGEDTPLILKDGEYGPTYQKIQVYHHEDKPKEYSVQFWFNRLLTEEELKQIKERLDSFHEVRVRLKIKEVRETNDLTLQNGQIKEEDFEKVKQELEDAVAEKAAELKKVTALGIKQFEIKTSVETELVLYDSI